MTNLKVPFEPLAYFLDLNPPAADFLNDAKEGLSKNQKSLSPMYFYDQTGSEIFEQITQIEEYYPTKTEQSVIAQHATAIRNSIGPSISIVEYGSGSSEKIRRLIDLLESPSSYIAMDISRDHLITNASALADEVNIPVGAVCADFNSKIDLPKNIVPEALRLGYFPGSTLGNLSDDAGTQFFNNANETLGQNAQFLIGIDLEKNKTILKSAYDDRDGVTARFNLNVLNRMQNELNASLDINAFKHEARILDDPQRVEMHLVATRETEIILDNTKYPFAIGESIHTENSRKFSKDALKSIIADTDWHLKDWWTDDKNWFATCLLTNA